MHGNRKLLILALGCAATVALIGAHEAAPAAKATTPPPNPPAMRELIVVHRRVPSPAPTPTPAPVKPVLPYDVPLAADVQEFLLAECEAEGVPPDLVVAIIAAESNFEADAISDTHDYGLMQINQGNHAWLSEELGITDFLDPKQNIKAGVFVLGGLCERYGSLNDTLMAYNLGPSGAARQRAQGVTSTAYSRKILAAMEELEASKNVGELEAHP